MEKKHRHFIIHKPFNFLSQFIANQNIGKKKLLGELDFDFPEGTMACGRLDANSEGLLILTTDGKVSDYITTRGNVEKEYYAQLDGAITETEIQKLREGVIIGFDGKKYLTKPAKVKLIDDPNFPCRGKKIRDARHGPTSWISVILTEGKFRQVRKMTSAVGFPTLRLVRVRTGNLKIEKLQAGSVTEIEDILSLL